MTGTRDTFVFVVGMHRSGTSALTGLLGALGLALPPESDLLTGQPDNPTHYESTSLIALNDRLLAAAGVTWDAPGPLAPGWSGSPALTAFDAEARAAVDTVFPGPGPAVWKDPRLCHLLPYWRRVVSRPQAAVLVWRRPGDVARSLVHRDGTTQSAGLALWERSTADALAGVAGLPVQVVAHDRLLADPAGTAETLATWLTGLGASPPEGGWDRAAAAGVIDPALDSTGDGRSGCTAPELDALVDRLLGLEGVHAAFPELEPLPSTGWGPDLLDERLSRRRAEQELAQIRSMARYRVTAPLRRLRARMRTTGPDQ